MKFCVDNIGRHAKEEWDALKNTINAVIERNETSKFNDEFEYRFSNTNRAYANLSVGFCVSAYIPFATVQNKEKGNQLVTYINDVLNNMKNLVNGK